MTREDVNERMRRKRFLHTLKHGKEQKWGVITHDGTDFTINANSTGDFWVQYG
jgi:hypothetical protein